MYSIIKKSNFEQHFSSFDLDCRNISGHFSDIIKSEKRLYLAF